MYARSFLSIALVLSIGCSSESVLEDGGTPQNDASPEDAMTSADSGPEVDSGSVDAGPESTDAGREPCTVGEMRPVSCGNCGTAQQLCADDGYWAEPGECLLEGECAPGAVEDETTPMCGERSRICSGTCEWSDWDVEVADGECAPGALRPAEGLACSVNEVSSESCTNDCEWEIARCVDPCGSDRREAPWDAEEVCVPTGEFTRGGAGTLGATPVASVLVDSFYIDRYPVTNRRYRLCVDSGACSLPADSNNADAVIRADAASEAVAGLTWLQAAAFCDWDGRRLPFEAEWEKAARGPLPRDSAFVWGSEASCAPLNARLQGRTCTADLGRSNDVDAVPTAQSYYGIDGLVGLVRQWVYDYHSWDYYASPGSLDNPRGPDVGMVRVFRGAEVGSDVSDYRVFTRGSNYADAAIAGVRCARNGI